VEDQLGRALGEPYIFAEGADPTGKPYRVWARAYDNGLVLVRNRGRWDEDIEPETAVPVALPAPLSPIDPSGAVSAVVSSISMRNGTGTILLGDVSEPPGDPVLRFSFPDPYVPHQPMRLEPALGGLADVAIFDIAGRRVRILLSGPVGRTVRELHWDGRTDGGVQVGSGLYYLDIRVGDAHIGRAVVLVK